MPKKILILSGSPQKDGNTATLIQWFSEGARLNDAQIEVVLTAFLKYEAYGCTSCRQCQKSQDYGCVIKDDASLVLAQMTQADVIVMATPLYFFGPSAQLKIIFDRMFSLYKWDNEAGTMKTVLEKKTFALLASAFEDIGLDALEKPFALTAEYTNMTFRSLIIPNAGVSGSVKNKIDAREKVVAFGRQVAS